MSKRNVIVILGILGLISWAIYENIGSSNESIDINQGEKSDSVSGKNVDIGIQEGSKAPDFVLITLNGEEVKLSDFVGKKIILNFWATWCPPCKAEMPHMQKFYHEQKDSGVEILAVNLTSSEKNEADIGEFIKSNELSFPVLLDQNGDIAQTYQAFTIPTSYVIDTNGIIRNKVVGPMDTEMMEELVKSFN